MNGSNWRKPLFVFLSMFLLIMLTTAVSAAQPPAPPDLDQALEPVEPDNPAANDDPADGPIMTEWVDPEGRQPMTFVEWESRQPEPDPTQVEQKFSSLDRQDSLEQQEADAGQPFVLALVNSSVYEGLMPELDQWRQDVMSEGWQVEIEAATFNNKGDLRAHLASKAGLDSVLLVGSFPVPMFETSPGDVFPIDLYYMDLDGHWSNQLSSSPWTNALDTHSGHTAPEIGLGRLTAGPLTFGAGELSLLKDYFADNHAYRSGALTRPARAVNIVDNDWAQWTGTVDALSLLYPGEVERVGNPWKTSGDTYRQLLNTPYQWLIVEAHASPFGQALSPRGRFNFQPQNAPTPGSPSHPRPWKASGRPYSFSYSSTFGWNQDLSHRSYWRSDAGMTDRRYDTLIEMQTRGELDAVWEAEAPNGRYCVAEIIAGDPEAYDGQYIIDLEGATVLNGRPTWGQRFVEKRSGPCVDVNDGKVTISSHSGARKNRLAYLDLQLANVSGWVSNRDIYDIGPESFFYNLFSCSAGRYIESNYIAGYFIFSDGPGLAAVASTKTGSMLDFDIFYEPLAAGHSLGRAFKEWFAGKGIHDRGWHYGMTLLGDPTLTMYPLPPQTSPTINICMDSQEDRNESISFVGDLGTFSLSDPDNKCHATTDLSAGTYSISQELPQDYYANDEVYCKETSGSGDSQWQPARESISIDLATGAAVTCTFYNVYNPGEPNDSLATAAPIRFGDTIDAVIGTHDDVEWYEDKDIYRFTAQANDKIIVDIDPSGNLTAWLILQDSAGNILDCVETWTSGRIAYDLDAAGEYYLLVTGSCGISGDGCDGPYTLTLQKGVGGSDLIYISPTREGSVGALDYARGDILSVDETGRWAMVFDATEQGVPSKGNLHAFTILDDGSLLLVFDRGLKLPGLSGWAKPWDIVKFTPGQPGDFSAGAFNWYFDGSDVGLSTSGEKIDALAHRNGRLYISTRAGFALLQDGSKLRGADEDILEFLPEKLGEDTAGSWNLMLDGSAVPGLAREDIASLSIESLEEGRFSIYFNTNSGFNIAGARGSRKDIVHLFACDSGLCAETDGRWPGLGFKKNFDGLHIAPAA